jgi:hypothetical protein
MSEQLSEHEQQQIEELHQKLVTGTAAAAAAGVDVCGIWKTIKPYWSIIVKAVGLIPRVGGIIAAALTALGSGLDLYCGGGHAAAAEGGSASLSADEEQQLHKLHADLFGGGGGGKGAAANAPQFCAAWAKIKPYWNTIISVIRKIPFVGGKIADVLQKLGQALDAICAGHK